MNADDYAALSDDEINRRVAQLEGWRHRGYYHPEPEGEFWEHPVHKCRRDVPPYCSDWSLTGPMAMERGIAIAPVRAFGGVSTSREYHAYSSIGRWATVCDTNPLRAICIVRLMMEDAK